MTVPDPISWSTAQRVTTRISGREPFSASYLGPRLREDFIGLTRTAEQLVGRETGLVANGPARVKVAERSEWIQANIASFQRLLRPLTERLSSRLNDSPIAPAGRALTGTQLGVVLGWMSTRVLGQYDLLLLEDDHPEDQDIVYYVGPNVLALEKRYGFPPAEFRLWIALHECTHRAQFTGVPWLPQYFRTQVSSILQSVDPDSKHLTEGLRRVAKEAKSGSNPVADGGLLTALSSPEQREALQRIFGLMALLEGHGDVTMARAAGDLIPNADRFHRVLHQRRSNSTGVSRVMQKLLGMDAKMKQYEQGERFIEAVEQAGGRPLMNLVWHGPANLPSYEEIQTPQNWIDRMQSVAHPA